MTKLPKRAEVHDATDAEMRRRLTFLTARMGTIRQIAEGLPTAAAQIEIARLAREALDYVPLQEGRHEP